MGGLSVAPTPSLGFRPQRRRWSLSSELSSTLTSYQHCATIISKERSCLDHGRSEVRPARPMKRLPLGRTQTTMATGGTRNVWRYAFDSSDRLGPGCPAFTQFRPGRDRSLHDLDAFPGDRRRSRTRLRRHRHHHRGTLLRLGRSRAHNGQQGGPAGTAARPGGGHARLLGADRGERPGDGPRGTCAGACPDGDRRRGLRAGQHRCDLRGGRPPAPWAGDRHPADDAGLRHRPDRRS